MNERMKTLDLLLRDHTIAPGWADALRRVAPEIDGKIEACLTRLAAAGPYLPTENVIWRAFKVPPAGVRVLILGQDPYPNEDHAVGLSFSTGPRGPSQLRFTTSTASFGGLATNPAVTETYPPGRSRASCS